MTVEPYAAEQRHPVSSQSQAYRVVLWRQRADTEEWWSETEDLQAEDVHEVIEWADSKALAEEATYTLYVRAEGVRSGDDLMVQLAGLDPTHNADNEVFHRPHPVSSSSP